VHVATATSQFVLSISALVGALTFLWLGSVDLRITALLGAGILVGAQVGARASLRAGSTMIRRLLAVSLALVGLRMALRGLGIG
jgi:uncharacterized membrane protein YfcA